MHPQVPRTRRRTELLTAFRSYLPSAAAQLREREWPSGGFDQPTPPKWSVGHRDDGLSCIEPLNRQQVRSVPLLGCPHPGVDVGKSLQIKLAAGLEHADLVGQLI